MSVLYLLFILLGIGLAVMGFTGKADNLIAAVTGHKYGSSTLA